MTVATGSSNRTSSSSTISGTTGSLKFRKDEPLYILYERFSKFGNKQVHTPFSGAANQPKKDPPMLDGTRFVKFIRDAGLIEDGKTPTNASPDAVLHYPITVTELDIIFNKVKAKTGRKITYCQFREACRLISVKKFILSKHSTAALSAWSDEDWQLQEDAALKMLDEILLKCPGPALGHVTVSPFVLFCL